MKAKFFSFLCGMLLCTTALFSAETEPNNSRAFATTLSLNSTNSGNISPAADVDWWKVTTNKDGKLVLTLTSNNSIYIWIYIYDNNGTTQLNTPVYTNSSRAVQTDGLAPGTYYIKIVGYYNTQTGGYTLSNSLVLPTQANDIEPNDSKLTALTLTQNNFAIGHVGYYYNIKRDTSDWYKVTTTKDGLIKLYLTSYNSQYVSYYLYDNNGTTLLNWATTNATGSLIKDGLAAGTYYIRVKTYYANGYSTYKLTDSLLTYAYANDKEPDNFPYQAKTIAANSSADGHLGFYYKGAYEGPDWWKIYYSGSGNLTLKVGQNLHLSDKAKQYYYMSLYKDTLAAPVSSTYYLGDATINLTGLTPHYYFIRIKPYYGNGYFAYRINPVFTQVYCNTLINVIATTVGSSCTNSSLTYICSNTQPPYKIQLYRYGAAYGSSVTTNSSYTFSSLPPGVYYARAYADGANGSCYGVSQTKSIMPRPTSQPTTNITVNGAKLNWTLLSCAKYYSVQYRISGTATWTSKNTVGNVANLLLQSLAANTTYEWRVAASDSANSLTAKSSYTDIANFKTAAILLTQKAASKDLNEEAITELKAYPNPARSTVMIAYKGRSETVSVQIKDMSGRTVIYKDHIPAASLRSPLDISRLPAGVYLIVVTSAAHELLSTRLVIER